MQNQNNYNLAKKGTQPIIADISKMVLSLLSEQKQTNLDSVENALTPILNSIRKHKTE